MTEQELIDDPDFQSILNMFENCDRQLVIRLATWSFVAGSRSQLEKAANHATKANDYIKKLLAVIEKLQEEKEYMMIEIFHQSNN